VRWNHQNIPTDPPICRHDQFRHTNWVWSTQHSPITA
jgi:hypothetical protein